jgi:hypothetical protein
MLFQPLPLVSLSANKKKHTGEQSERLTSKYCCIIGVSFSAGSGMVGIGGKP